MTHSPQELAREAGRGRSGRTPFLALNAVTIAVLVAFVVVCGLAFLAYYLA
jgi:hypothetical protein